MKINTASAGRRVVLAMSVWICAVSAGVAQENAPDRFAEIIRVSADQAAGAPAESPPPAPPAPKFDGSFFERPYLTGDWGGARSEAAQNGIGFDLSNTQFYQGASSGGTDGHFRYGGRFDMLMNVDGKKAGLWEGFFVTLHGEAKYGQSAGFASGGLSPTNVGMLFPVPNETLGALTGVKFTQALSEEFVVFGGKLNFVDEYQHPFAAGRGNTQFMNTSLAFPTIFGRTTPYSTLGAGAAILHEGQPIFAFSVLDPSGRPTDAGFDRLFSEGVVLEALLSIPVELWERPGHQTLMAAWSSRTFNALQPIDFLSPLGLPVAVTQEEGSWCVMYGFDQYLFVDEENPKQGWGVFAQASVSDGQANPMRSFFTAGIGGNSRLPGRGADTFGIGYYLIGISSQLAQAVAPVAQLHNEQGCELFYNIAIAPSFHVTADFQFINPTRESVDPSVFCGLRAKIDF